MNSFFQIDSFIAFLIVFMRMSGLIGFNPIFGRRNVPDMVKIGLSLIFALLVYTYSDITYIGQISTTVEIVTICLTELIIGVVMGFVVSLFSYVIILGGEVVDMQIGLAMAKVYDPASNVSMSLSGTFYNIMFVFTFFAVNGHLSLMRFFLNLETILPYGNYAVGQMTAMAIMNVFSACTILGVKIAMPMIGLQFLMEIGVGILMRNIPQINVIMINMQAKVFVGLLFIIILFSPMMSFMEELIQGLFDTLTQVALMMK